MPARIPAVASKDRTVVNVARAEEVVWWAAELSVSPDELHDAIESVGPSPEEIRRHLREAAKKCFQGGGED